MNLQNSHIRELRKDGCVAILIPVFPAQLSLFSFFSGTRTHVEIVVPLKCRIGQEWFS